MKKRSTEFYNDRNAADLAVNFFPLLLRHVKGEWAGQELKLMRWMERDIIRPLFGQKRRSDHTRRYRTAYIEVPRKNAKSTLSAGLAIYLTFCDGEPGAEVYSAAADRDQARIVFEDAKKMIEASPELHKRAEIFRNSIVVHESASSYKVLSADVPTKHGLNAHGIIFDELHTQPNRELWDVLKTSTGSRRQPLIIAITTAGYDRHSICWELHDYALKVRDGVLEDPTFLPVIYAADEKDDWKNPKIWAKANPGLGISLKTDYLATECKVAQETPAYENTFRRLHLNQWTEQDVRWMPMEVWDACGAAVEEEALVGRRCFAGLDLATTTDIAALCLLFPPVSEGEPYKAIFRFWVPRENVKKRGERDRVPYQLWIDQGHIEATEGTRIDYDVIRTRIGELAKRFEIVELAKDPWNSTQIGTQLMDDGMTVVDFGQGFASMTSPTKELMALCLSKQLAHGGNPVMRWMASNVVVRQDPAGNLKPDKGKSTERIDGWVALTMPLGRAMVTPDSTSIYERQGIDTI